ncbi:hypothetical protein U1Q18_014091 [Sarracenia purpurea var. burkii]
MKGDERYMQKESTNQYRRGDFLSLLLEKEEQDITGCQRSLEVQSQVHRNQGGLSQEGNSATKSNNTKVNTGISAPNGAVEEL